MQSEPSDAVRAVLDTNVLVSAVLTPEGTPARVFRAALLNEYRIVTTEALLTELEIVLHRPHLRLSENNTTAFLDLIKEVALLVEPTVSISVPGLADSSDIAVVAAAIAGRADAIVTGDRRHLLPLREFRGIPLVTPRAFLARLAANRGTPPETEY